MASTTPPIVKRQAREAIGIAAMASTTPLVVKRRVLKKCMADEVALRRPSADEELAMEDAGYPSAFERGLGCMKGWRAGPTISRRTHQKPHASSWTSFGRQGQVHRLDPH